MEYRDNTVLFVDDEPRVSDGLIRQLYKEPFRTLSASSAQEALQILAGETIDVLITDEQMPRMTGAQLVAQVRKDYPRVICMILSGQTDFDAAIRSINEGEIYRFLRKPCDPLDIAINIRLALEQRELIIQSRKLLDQYQQELMYLRNLQKSYPDLFDVKYDDQGCILIDEIESASPWTSKRTIEDICKELTRGRKSSASNNDS